MESESCATIPSCVRFSSPPTARRSMSVTPGA
jgi:hypothetical protein